MDFTLPYFKFLNVFVLLLQLWRRKMMISEGSSLGVLTVGMPASPFLLLKKGKKISESIEEKKDLMRRKMMSSGLVEGSLQLLRRSSGSQ